MNAPRTRGKRSERRVATAIGGNRVGNSGLATPDVVSALFCVEVRNRINCPSSVLAMLVQARLKSKRGQIPLYVFKRPRWQRYVVCMFLDDFQDLHGKVESHDIGF